MNENIVVKLGADISDLSKGLASAKRDLDGFGNDMKNVGAGMAQSFGAATLAIGAGLGFAVNKAADFDSQIRKAGAIAGASAKELDAMKQSALELGATTSQSASSAAAAMTELAAKGFDANQVIAAMPGIISAAEASGEDLSLAADTVASALNIFGLEAAESSRVADVLAESANTSAAGIDDLGYVLKYAGAPAAALGIALEEVAAAAGVMTNAGLDGSNAGTALRAALLALNSPAEAQSKMMDKLGISTTDASGKTKTLSGIIENVTKSLQGQTEAEKVATLSKLVGTEAVSGFLSLMKAGPKEIDKMSSALKDSGGASEKAAKKMKAGIGGALENLSGAFESLTITIGDQLVPYVEKAAKWLTKLADKFSKLKAGTKKFIVVGTAVVGIFSALAAGIGITLAVVGSAITGIGAIGAAFGIAGGAAGVFGGALALLTGPVGIAIGAIALAGVAIVGLVKHFKQDAIPEVDRFGDKVSDTTKKSLSKFFELSDGVAESMAELSITSGKVTEEIKENMITKFAEMNKQILGGMQKRHKEQLASMSSFFANSSVLTDEQEAVILNAQKRSNESQLTEQQKREDRIKEIIEKAYKEKRELTTIEEAAINGIKDEMNRAAVKSLSESEVEQKIILERMALTAGNLSAIQAAAVVKNSAEQRDKTVKAAEETYDGTLAEIIRMRDETGAITSQTADKMIAEAGRSRDGTVKHAQSMHAEVITEAQKQAKEHVDEVDWETGQIKSEWAVLWADLKKGWDDYIYYMNNTNMFQIGKDIMTGLKNGIDSMGRSIIESAKSISNSVVKWTKKTLDIHSPSRVMKDLGKWTGLGLVEGLDGEASTVAKSAQALANAAVAKPTLSYTTPGTSYGSLSGALSGAVAASVDVSASEDTQLLREIVVAVREGQIITMDSRKVGGTIAPHVKAKNDMISAFRRNGNGGGVYGV